MTGVDPALVKRVREGTYEVDPHAVAGAIVGRLERARIARRLSEVLEAAEVDERTAGPDEPEPGAGAHLS